MKWLKTLMLIGLVPQALVLILMIYHYAKVQRHARASKKRLHRAARDTELLDRLLSNWPRFSACKLDLNRRNA